MPEVRLQKYLATAGLCSRRRAEALMREGRVKVDGIPATELGFKIDPALVKVTVDDQAVSQSDELGYYMFHKPGGYLTSLSDPQGRPTIRPFLEALPIRVFPVGRLDRDVSGLLILTNDGELGKRLMHPSYMVPKIYRTLVRGDPGEEELNLLRSGRLIIEGKPAAPAEARIVRTGPDRGWLELVLTEGRHRQVKRMCGAVGHGVIKLKRLAYCGLWLPEALKAGEIMELSLDQVNALKTKVGLGDF
jgi:pseudouridine synthase